MEQVYFGMKEYDPAGGWWDQDSSTFNAAAVVWSTATFSEPGAYVLRLAADDGQFATHDDMTVVVVKRLP